MSAKSFDTQQWELFRRKAGELGAPLDEMALARFCRYLEELQEWNRTVRLVSRADLPTVLWFHFMDSLTVVPLILGQGPLLDVGSGAGFPGIPLKIAKPDLRVHLLESRRRRANFLRHLIRTLKLEEVQVHQERVGGEGLPLGHFPMVVARAVAPPPVWLEWAARLLAEGGRLLLMLGERPGSEELSPLLRKLGWAIVSSRQLRLPVVERKRCILVVERAARFT